MYGWVKTNVLLEKRVKRRALAETYASAINHWCCMKLVATSNMERPTSVMVGTMVRGPMKRSRNPSRPVEPTTTWTREASMMFPWIWRTNQHYIDVLRYLTRSYGRRRICGNSHYVAVSLRMDFTYLTRQR